ncbi:Protein phosphatase 1 regulatory subunit 8 [Seminavis robusta]|uniref:Protein phosphatase 1 regulatory subunit 8 n=1 Tax=Seminavis robusta TaxID=568900 RepID=A0A9N8HMA8_9STRA|nr:Protein phosphatase 1 regulatory subunit 8 [Seminavis robusta]|eukprot:Sro1099_g241200.1 Protein phosphatase 1 regulatory subunit 8 (402) ;mRNA; r:34428-35895
MAEVLFVAVAYQDFTATTTTTTDKRGPLSPQCLSIALLQTTFHETSLTTSQDDTPAAPLSPVRVDVRLCGSIPRSDMVTKLGLRGAPCPLSILTSADLNASQLAETNACDSSTLLKSSISEGPVGRFVAAQQRPMARIQSDLGPPAPVYEPPSWAVPARGEARLEPVCEALGRQTSVDLTSKSSFRVGRSPQSDVQLNHGTSSRRHALLFHHSNGSCYIVDCGSAHGTYVNGVRITSPPNGGVVIPYKVRRGAMIRFGGPGAPCFVLKSFSFQLEELAEPTTQNASIEGSESDAVVVQKNTRLNALGQTAIDSVRFSIISMACKRSFDTLDGEDFEEPCSKRARCSSPPLSPEEPMRLVSPDMPSSSKHRRVSFSTDPPIAFYPALVTPEELSSDEDNGCY